MSKSANLFIAAGFGAAAMYGVAINTADRLVTEVPEEARIVAATASPELRMIAAAMAASAPAPEGKMGLGRPATEDEVAAWNKDVSPDGTGLPEGSGSVEDGEMLFSENCAICHGEFAEGVDNWPKLAGGKDTLNHDDPLKTVGSYWPYLSTVFDYVHRSMPFGNAQSLSADDTYAITAYILYSNDMVDDDFVLSKENFLEVEMTNPDGFIIDDRETSERHFWNASPCMTDCKESVEITMRAAVLDVTPEEDGDEAAAEAEETPTQVAAAAPAPKVEEVPKEEPKVETAAAAPAAADPELAAKGEKVFKKCKACHQVGEGAKNKTGPQLNGVVGRTIGGVDGFKYSGTLAGMTDKTWTEAELSAFLEAPKKYAKGTKMSFAGLKKETDRAALIEYLKTFQ